MDLRILTVKEAAQTLNVGKRAVYDLVSNGQLEAVRVGRSIRIPQQSIEKYIKLTASTVKTERELELEEENEYLKKCLRDKEVILNNIKIELLKSN